VREMSVCLSIGGEWRIARGRAHNATCGKEYPPFHRKKRTRRRPVVSKIFTNYQSMDLSVCLCQLIETWGEGMLGIRMKSAAC
jgi:hypothetical protein